MTQTLIDKVDSEHIKKEVREFESKWEKADEQHYRDDEGYLVPIIKEELFPIASEKYGTFVSKINKEEKYELSAPDIAPCCNGSIDFFWETKDRDTVVLLNIHASGDASFAYHIRSGEQKNGELK